MTEAEVLLTDVFNCDRASLYLNKDLSPLMTKLNKIFEDCVIARSEATKQSNKDCFALRARNDTAREDKVEFISSVLKRRISGEPLQYILGKTEFMGLEFKVTPDVLIPRPETEILVETAIKIASGLRSTVYGLNVLDIGTGSGCIAISLAKSLPQAQITAIDISKRALEIARLNAVLNNVSGCINFIQSDLFPASGLRSTVYGLQSTVYSLIVSNPPYIASSEINNLQPEIKYEPRIALDGGCDGLDFYRKIIKGAPRYLKKGGFLIMEMGFNQKGAIENIAQESEDLDVIEIIKDYNNIDRVIIMQNHSCHCERTIVERSNLY
ncbi:MAG: peptide chain release factor N(5)-glutamine methyltransferase [Candidatus Omnitrophota bacterium]